MVAMNKIQTQWKNDRAIGYDCIAFGDGRIVIANTYDVVLTETKEHKRYWFPLCDTTLEGIEKYDEDIWTCVDVFHGSFSHAGQTFVFGDGAMGNEGFVASVDADGNLNWSIFFTFSNPIVGAEIDGEHLVCFGETGTVVRIDLRELTQIDVRFDPARA